MKNIKPIVNQEYKICHRLHGNMGPRFEPDFPLNDFDLSKTSVSSPTTCLLIVLTLDISTSNAVMMQSRTKQ